MQEEKEKCQIQKQKANKIGIRKQRAHFPMQCTRVINQCNFTIFLFGVSSLCIHSKFFFDGMI